jgi:hypothetical protein
MSKVPITVQLLYYKYKSQNTTEYRSMLSGVGEVITSIQRYLWQHEYGRGPLSRLGSCSKPVIHTFNMVVFAVDRI